MASDKISSSIREINDNYATVAAGSGPGSGPGSGSGSMRPAGHVFVIDPELQARQLEYEDLCNFGQEESYHDGDDSEQDKADDTVKGDNKAATSDDRDEGQGRMRKGHFKSRLEVKKFFEGLESDEIRAEVAGTWLDDSFHARPIEYPANSKELDCLFTYRSTWLFYLFNVVAILQIVGPLVEKPWCGDANVEAGHFIEDHRATRLLFSLIDVLAVVVYSYDMYLLMSLNFQHYKTVWHKKGWTNIRLLAVILLFVDLIYFYSKIGQNNSPRLIRCMYPIFFISRRRNLRLMVQGLGRSIYYTRHIIFLLFCVLVLWGFVGYFVFAHVPENLNRWSTPWNAIFTCLHGFTSRPAILIFVNGIFEHSKASMIFFVSLSLVADLLCLSFIVANGTREYKLYCVKVLNQRLFYRRLALNSIFDAYSTPLHAVTTVKNREESNNKSLSNSQPVPGADLNPYLDPQLEVMRKSDWMALASQMPGFITEKERQVLAQNASIMFDLEEKGLTGGTCCSRSSFFRMCALVSAKVNFGRDADQGASRQSDADIMRNSLGNLLSAKGNDKDGSDQALPSLFSSQSEADDLRPSVELHSKGISSKLNINTNSTNSLSKSPLHNPLLQPDESESESIVVPPRRLTDDDKIGNIANNGDNFTSPNAYGDMREGATVELKDASNENSSHYIEDTFDSVRHRWGHTAAIALKQLITACRLYFLVEMIFKKNSSLRCKLSELISIIVHILLVIYLCAMTDSGSAAVFNLGWCFQGFFWLEIIAELAGFGKRGAENKGVELLARLVINFTTFIMMFLVDPARFNSPALIVYVIAQGFRLFKLFFVFNDYPLFRSLMPLLGRCLFIYFSVVYFFSIWAQIFFCSRFNENHILSRNADDDSESWLKFSNILNFDSLPLCLFTMFEISILGSWSIVMDALARSTTDAGLIFHVFLFFYAYRLIMTLAIIPVLLSFIMQAFLTSSTSLSVAKKQPSHSPPNSSSSSAHIAADVQEEAVYRDTVDAEAVNRRGLKAKPGVGLELGLGLGLGLRGRGVEGPLGFSVRMEVNPTFLNRNHGQLKFDPGNKSSAIALWANNDAAKTNKSADTEYVKYIKYLEAQLAISTTKISELEMEVEREREMAMTRFS